MDQVSNTSPINIPHYVENFKGKKVWTDEGILAVIKGFVAGKSMLILATEFQTTVGAIAGLLSRARKKKLLPPPIGRGPTVKVVKRKPKKGTDPLTLKFKKIVTASTIPQKKVRLKIVDPQTVTFEDLKSHHCRFPFGDPRHSDFRFCGKPRLNENVYFCSDHCNVVYTGTGRVKSQI